MATVIKKAAPKPLPVQLTAKPKPAPKEYAQEGEQFGTVEEEVVLEAKQAVASVNKKFKDGTETDEQVPVGEVKAFKAPHATVGLTMAVTRNLGNYESVKMSVSLYMPCENNEQAMQETFDEVKGWVDTRVELLNQEVNEQLA